MSGEERQQALEHLAVKQSLLNLTTFSFVAAAVERGTLELHGAWFSIGKGQLMWLDPDRGTFEVVTSSTATLDHDRQRLKHGSTMAVEAARR